ATSEYVVAASVRAWARVPGPLRRACSLLSFRSLVPRQLPRLVEGNLRCPSVDTVYSSRLASGDCVARGFRGRPGSGGDHGDSAGESLDEEYCQGVQEGSDPER